MKDPHAPLEPATHKPGEVTSEVPETSAPEEDLVEGPLPGLPTATDPLLNPIPVPGERTRRPLD